MAINVTETDLSEVFVDSCSASGLVVLGALHGHIKPRVIGKFPLSYYYSLSHRRKVQLKKDFKAGRWQQREFFKAFGHPR